jgi:hypothetical protein
MPNHLLCNNKYIWDLTAGHFAPQRRNAPIGYTEKGEKQKGVWILKES